jgi:tetratricopeptide (TPR) repeat protein
MNPIHAFGALTATALLLFVAPLLSAQTASERWDEARQSYADGDFDTALTGGVAAIQQSPASPEYYLGVARILFQLERFDDAVFYYDIYIDHFGPLLPSDTPDRQSVRRAREERNTANGSRQQPGTAPIGPESQNQARATLLTRIQEGTALTASGGGALAIYDAMLRSGYSRPDLLQLRAQLRACILAEGNLFVSPTRLAIPALSIEQWTTQRNRMRRYVELAPEALETPSGMFAGTAEADAGRAMLFLAEGQLEYLNQDYADSATAFGQAMQADPTVLPSWIGYLNALYGQQRGLTESTRAAIAEFGALTEEVGGEAPMLHAIYEAAFIAQSGRRADAITMVESMLGY